ncbi:MAG TPA: agmatine deiminase family protein [Bacteroidota bacterium]|nr:agmatine deiminase family protein [Bacteroidota bacterium]
MNINSPYYRFPAEWENHEATWLAWPHHSADWPGKFAAIPWVFGEIARHIVAGEMLHLIVSDRAHELKARRVLEKIGVDLSRIRFFRIPTDRGWMRDSGPMFVQSQKRKTSILRFQFNGWAKYSNWHKDNETSTKASKTLKLPLTRVTNNGHNIVLEGGSIDLNGSGTLITTEECLLDPKVQARNPGFSAADYEEVFRTYLGASNVLWLGNGVAGDDTHGHIDDLCRFVNKTTVVLCEEKNPLDLNYMPLKENRERLRSMKLETGSSIEVVSIPMPAPVVFEGRRLPASYANFYFTNSCLLVPTFNDPNDRIALGILAELVTDRPVIGISATDLIWGLGTIHCLTQQQPAV